MISLLESYRHKIKSAEELRQIIGAPPRRRRVIMCHGVFDVVHPGHVRHLLYAKSKADILVASITADKHITKGLHRPHVPQDLRAVNLAAFEVVDYVVIDKNDTPLNNIRIIQPDLFAKGFEYNSKGLAPKTAAEAEVVSSYGGSLIFTPGDIVYSSSALINLAPPEMKLEKLQSVLDNGGRPDHWGLQGMRERSERIGGQMKIWSRPDAGTEVELTVPGATAYESDSSKSKRSWFRRSSRDDGEEQ